MKTLVFLIALMICRGSCVSWISRLYYIAVLFYYYGCVGYMVRLDMKEW